MILWTLLDILTHLMLLALLVSAAVFGLLSVAWRRDGRRGGL